MSYTDWENKLALSLVKRKNVIVISKRRGRSCRQHDNILNVLRNRYNIANSLFKSIISESFS